MEFYIRQAVKFLDLNWEKKIFKNHDLDHNEVASILGFRKYRPSLKMCKRNFSLTIEKFYMHCRVAEVKQFLAQPESRRYELLEIAHKFGYPHRRNFNRQFKLVAGITQREFWFFHEHFVQTTGMSLVEYEEPELDRYRPKDGKPTFLSNFLNAQMTKVLYNKRNL